MYSLLPAFPQEITVGVDFSGHWILPLIRLRRFQQVLAYGFAVEVELLGNRRHAPPVLLQVSDVHKSLQCEHRAPSEERKLRKPREVWPDGLLHLGKFQPAEVGNFQP